MPNFDGGHYFLTALIPIRTDDMGQAGVATSPVHALRKLLARLPASPTLRFHTPDSPFARVQGLHLARLVIIDDVAYNGRVGEDAILARIKGRFNPAAANPLIPQQQDHLPRPYLLLAMEFDVADDSENARDTFLKAMWGALSKEIGELLQYAVGFDKLPANGSGFASYIAACQIDTTMSFNDYYIDPPALQDWTDKAAGKGTKIAALVGAVSIAIGVIDLLAGLIWPHLLAYAGVFLVLAGLILAGAAIFAVATISKQGSAAFPTDPRTNLQNILKALYLQRAFTAFAIANQRHAGRDADETALHAAFGQFLDTHKPAQLGHPTQRPGVLGI